MAIQDRFAYFAPTRLSVGRGAVEEIPGLLSGHCKNKALVVTDPGLVRAGLMERVTSVLEAAGQAYAVYDGVEENPPIAVVHACAERYREEGCDALIGVGGGSSMDVAKAAGVVLTNGGEIGQYFGLGKVEVRIPFCLCVPTTYGTGSEVTPFAVVTDDHHFKASVVGPEIIPDVGVLDSDMAVALPFTIAGATGMDALTHAIESYTSRGSDLISEGLAIYAIQLIAENLRRAASTEHDHEATERMLVGSTVAGIAFSQSRLGNVHAMSHPVGGHRGVPHGVANAIILTRVMEYNRIACPGRFADIAAAMGVNVDGLEDMEAAAFAVEAVEELGCDVGIPETLTEAGVDPNDIPVLAEDAMKSPLIDFNPRKTTVEDVIALYEACM